MEINPDKPNCSRIYDYIIGGNHHFAADRETAEQLLRILPEFHELELMNRWFLTYAIEQLSGENFPGYLDFATGLPTGGYVHQYVPVGAKIMYNDIDPVTMAYAQQVNGENPNIGYICADMRQIESILQQSASFFGPTPRLGICMVGVVQHLDDAAVAAILQQLYAWAAPGSQLAIHFLVADAPHTKLDSFVRTYHDKVGIPVIVRSSAKVPALMQPWQPLGGGMQDIRAILDLADIGRNAEGTEYTIGGIYYKPR